MKCSSSSRPKRGSGGVDSAFGFLGLKRIFLKVMVAAMGCVFSCFGVKDSRANRGSSSSTATANDQDTVVTRRRRALSSLLMSEENYGTPIKEKEDLELGIPKAEVEFDIRELKAEAKFLKACGTQRETPVELRKDAEVKKDLSGQNGEHEDQKVKSWLTNTSIDNLERQLDQPQSHIKLFEEWVKESDSLDHTPSSCMTERQNTERFSSSPSEVSGIQNATSTKVIARMDLSPTSSSVSTNYMAPSVQYKNKSVRFDCEPDVSSSSSKSYSSEISSQNSMQYRSAGNEGIGKPSPYPTPLKLTDEMQTPGTVFPAYLDVMGQAKSTRIRSQYVYPVLNPVESLSQLKALKDEDSNSNDLNNDTGESLGNNDEANPITEVGKGEHSVAQDLKVEASLSPWLRAPPSNLDGNSQHNGSSVGANFHFRRTQIDRPILGMVAAHWNNDEPSRVSPKWWDGNGIPNSTNKYKEDQKVSWHATPFEERLEKALSEETFISQGKEISGTGAINFNEAEESDTAQSQFQSSKHFKSVVSH